jgi:ketosteroid isomerase-like protein
VDTRTVVDSYFTCVNTGRWDDYLELFSPEVVMDEQLAGHLEGRAAIADSIQGLRANPDFRNRPVEILVDGDRAMASWHITSSRPDGSTLDVRGVNFFRISAGQISYFANYHDTAPFASPVPVSG